MTQQERILQLAQEQITYLGHRGRKWGENFKVGFNGGIRFTLENLWISVEEDLPKDKESVFVRDEDGRCTSAWYSPITETWFLTMGEIGGEDAIYTKITHWMPIPEMKGSKK
jgi:hypothetical protein